MTIFFSASQKGFYDHEIHGARLTTIPDPAWIRPKVNIVVQPGESVWVVDELMTNTGEEPITLSDVPDMSAMPDTFDVTNPDCLIPEDAVEITQERYIELLEGLSTGLRVSGDKDGYPILIDPPGPSADELMAQERLWRDRQLSLSDGVVARHRDEVEEGVELTLTAAQYLLLQAYRRQLRNWPEDGEFPLIEHRPVAPDWLVHLTQ